MAVNSATVVATALFVDTWLASKSVPVFTDQRSIPHARAVTVNVVLAMSPPPPAFVPRAEYVLALVGDTVALAEKLEAAVPNQSNRVGAWLHKANNVLDAPSRIEPGEALG